MNRVPPSSRPFVQALGLADVVLMNIVAVVGLRWIARGARMGPSSIVLWTLAGLTFFLPLAAALMELASRYPAQGGLYVWTRRAFGPVHGFLCGWCLWVNNLFYFPSLLLFAAANLPHALGPEYVGLVNHRGYSVAFVLGGLWLSVGLNIVGFGASKWLHNLGSLGTWIPAGLLITAGLVALRSFGSATPLTVASLVPQGDWLATLSLWSALCFAFSGFEIASLVGLEVRDPRRTVPRGILIAGAATLVIYTLGSLAVLVAIPASAFDERSGITEAIALVADRVGLSGLGGVTAALLALGAIAGTNSWFAGAARVPFAAGVDAVMPRAFAALHPRFRTPHVALLVQGVAATALFLTSVFLTLAGARTTVQEAYDIMVNLTILIYFVPYLYLFLALPRLRPPTDAPEAGVLRVPGGRLGLYAVTASGALTTLISLLLVFVPPPGTENVWNYLANLILQAVAILGTGGALYWQARRRGAEAGRSSGADLAGAEDRPRGEAL
jgi:amino acid transporter